MMAINKSFETYLRFLKEKHELFKNNLNNLLSVLVGDKKDIKKKSAEECLKSANSLKESLSSQDIPDWLHNSIGSINGYLKNFNNSGANNSLLKKIMSFYNQAISYKWQFDEHQTFDFDAIFQQCKNESRVDEFFDDIISYLEQIINSAEVDSIKIKTTLEKLIATLNKHANASYFSLYSMWDFLSHLMKNVLWEELESIPGLSGIVKGFRKTVEETGIEFNQLHENIHKTMSQKFKSDFTFLETKTNNLLKK